MATRTLTAKPIPKTFAELRAAVMVVVVEGRRAIDRAWVESYHEIGRLIYEHLLLKKERAAYGASVYSELAEESGISRRTLYECVQFFRYFPIVRGHAQLSRTHYQLLCQVPDASRREALLRETIKNGWTSDDLRPRVRTTNAVAIALRDRDSRGVAVTPPKIELLQPNRGTPGRHRIIARGEGMAVDLGFKLYWPLAADQARRLGKGDIVRITEDDSLQRVAGASKAELFTYAATLLRVVDGDTLVVELEVSPGVFIEQKLRLRGLDCPELKTSAGKAAKRFVDALVSRATAVVINTSKPDKYDRYLADVFLTTEAAAKGSGEAGEIFLNNHLLENGQAVRKDEWEFGDWEPGLLQ